MGILNMIYRYFRGMPAILFRVLQTVKEFHVGVLGENPMVTPIPCRGFGRKPFVVGIMAKVLVLGENPMVAGLVINGVVLGCYANATDSGVRPTPLLLSFICSEDICQSQYYSGIPPFFIKA